MRSGSSIAWGRLLVGLTVLGLCASLSGQPGAAEKDKKGVPAMKITSTAFEEGATIPKPHTGDGKNVSPSLKWNGALPETKSFALVCDDPDAPGGTWNHWLLWDVPAAAHSLAEGFKPGQTGVSGTNDFGRQGYGGPCPPKGKGAHRYFFKLFALNVASLGLKAGAKRGELDRVLKGRVVGEAEYVGRYERK